MRRTSRADPPVLCLLGPMGAGKTTVGALLAHRLGRPHIDLDRLVEERLGQSVAALFAAGREPEFRGWESRLLRRVLAGPPSVLSPGGGIVLRARNRLLLACGATVVYLSVTEDEQRRRLAGDADRPLLARGLSSLAATNAERLPHYEALARLTVPTAGRTPEAVANDVLRALARVAGGAP